MKNSNSISKILLAYLLFSILGCSDYNHFNPYGNVNDDLVYLQSLRPASTQKLIDPVRANTLSTADSVLLEIPKDAFRDHFNASYSDEVLLSFQMLTKPAHLIAYDISLVDGQGNLIIPEALFYAGAYTPNGHLLKLEQGKTLQVKYPIETAFSPLELYFPNDAETANNLNEWLKAESGNQHFGIYEETWSWKSMEGEIRQSSGQLINTGKLKWLTLGASLETEDGCELQINTTEEFNPINTRVFAVGKSFPFVVKLDWDEERHAFCDKNNRIPIETEIHLVSITKMEGYFYYDEMTLNTETKLQRSLEPEKIDLDLLLQRLNNL